MNQTEQFHLNQWEKSDRIMMEDFNADNLKMEQALEDVQNEAAEALAAVKASLSDLIVVGTYVGEGSSSSVFGPATINLGFQPRFLMIRDTTFKGDQVSTGWHPGNLGFAVPGYGHYAGGSALQFEIRENGFFIQNNFSYKNHVFSYIAIR